MASKRIKCSGCGRRIPDSVPDVMVRKLGEEHNRRFFHQACIGAAQRMMMADPFIWRITHRYIDERMN